MRDFALFLNGVFDGVLQEILEIQAYLPEQIMFLQPYSSRRIVRLAESQLATEKPIRLFVSVTDDLAMVRYAGEIVGWDDKRQLAGRKLNALNRVIYALQPNEDGIYGLREPGKPDMVNLLHVRRLKHLSKPFSVAELTVESTEEPHSTYRSTAGGWSYVVNPSDQWLAEYL